jgi:3-oxoacyl-[acyl-carrier protein] reductase
MAGRAVLVTGASRGVGRAVAVAFAAAGDRVAVHHRASAPLAADTLRGLAGDGHVVVQGDLADAAAVRAFVDAAADGLGGLDVLVNNAGGWRYGTAREITMPDWDWTFRTNVTAPFLTTRVLMDLMTARRYGRIVNVASTDAYRPKPKLPHYAAAKAAVVSLTRSLAEELAPHQVIVNAVSPGAIATETAKGQGWLAERAKSIPLGRVAEPEDIAEVILFLASKRNRFVVGETVIANGGMLMI